MPPTDGSAQRDNPLVPSDWLTAPIFTIKPIENREPVAVRFQDREWRFGVPSPTDEPSRPMTLDHAAVLFTVLGVYQEQKLLLQPEPSPNGVSLSLKELARRVSTYQSSHLRRELLKRLDDLRHTWCEYDHPVVVLDKGKPVMHEGKPVCAMATDTFSLLSDYAMRKIWSPPDQPSIDHTDKEYVDLEVWQQQNGIAPQPDAALPAFGKAETRKAYYGLKRVVLAPEFIVLAREITRWIHVRLGEFRTLRSDIARAIYLYIPSRAAYRSAKNPWPISLTKLLAQIGVPVPQHPSQRKKIFVQNGSVCKETTIDGRLSHSIVAQLDGRTMAGGIFRCRIEKNAAETDYLFVCWRDDVNQKTTHDFKVYDDALVLPDKPSKLRTAWLSSGRTHEEYLRRVSPPPQIEDFEAQWLEEASIATTTTVLFFRMAKGLLGEVHFHSLLREAVQETNAENPTGLLISRILAAVESLPPPKPAAAAPAAAPQA